MASLAAIALLAGAVQFAPGDGAGYRVTTIDERGGSMAHRFRFVSKLVFARVASEWQATLTLVEATSNHDGATADRFAAATRAQLGRPVVYRLGRSGTAITVVDPGAAGLEAAYAGLARGAPEGAAPAIAAARTRTAAALVERIAPLLAPADTRAGTRAVTLPGSDGTTLDGTRTVRRTGAVVAIATEARDARVIRSELQEIDAGTGVTRHHRVERSMPGTGTLIARSDTVVTPW